MSWLARPDGSPGRPVVFSVAAIPVCLSIIVLFKLPLRQTTGMVASLLKTAGLDWAASDDMTLCRRQKTLTVQIPCRCATGPLILGVHHRRSRLWYSAINDGQTAEAQIRAALMNRFNALGTAEIVRMV